MSANTQSIATPEKNTRVTTESSKPPKPTRISGKPSSNLRNDTAYALPGLTVTEAHSARRGRFGHGRFENTAIDSTNGPYGAHNTERRFTLPDRERLPSSARPSHSTFLGSQNPFELPPEHYSKPAVHRPSGNQYEASTGFHGNSFKPTPGYYMNFDPENIGPGPYENPFDPASRINQPFNSSAPHYAVYEQQPHVPLNHSTYPPYAPYVSWNSTPHQPYFGNQPYQPPLSNLPSGFSAWPPPYFPVQSTATVGPNSTAPYYTFPTAPAPMSSVAPLPQPSQFFEQADPTSLPQSTPHPHSVGFQAFAPGADPINPSTYISDTHLRESQASAPGQDPHGMWSGSDRYLTVSQLPLSHSQNSLTRTYPAILSKAPVGKQKKKLNLQYITRRSKRMHESTAQEMHTDAFPRPETRIARPSVVRPNDEENHQETMPPPSWLRYDGNDDSRAFSYTYPRMPRKWERQASISTAGSHLTGGAIEGRPGSPTRRGHSDLEPSKEADEPVQAPDQPVEVKATPESPIEQDSSSPGLPGIAQRMEDGAADALREPVSIFDSILPEFNAKSDAHESRASTTHKFNHPANTVPPPAKAVDGVEGSAEQPVDFVLKRVKTAFVSDEEEESSRPAHYKSQGRVLRSVASSAGLSARIEMLSEDEGTAKIPRSPTKFLEQDAVSTHHETGSSESESSELIVVGNIPGLSDLHPHIPYQDQYWENTQSEITEVDPLETFDFTKFAATRPDPDIPNVTDCEVESVSGGTKQQRKGFDQLDILHSRWAGDPFKDAERSAEITVASQEAETMKPSIRWLHMKRDLMLFDELLQTVHQCSDLAENVKSKVASLLQTIKDEKQRQRQHGCDMEATFKCDFDHEDNDTAGNSQSSIMFACLPVLSLDQYNGNTLRSLPPGSAAHPTRGFIQAYSRAIDDKRELMQAITTRPDVPNGHCLHVSSLWCLIVNESLMITCSRLGIEELCGEIIKRHSAPLAPRVNELQITWDDAHRWQIPDTTRGSLPRTLALFGERDGKENDVLEMGINFCHGDELMEGRTWASLNGKSGEQLIKLTLEKAQRTRTFANKRSLNDLEQMLEPPESSLFIEINDFTRANLLRGNGETDLGSKNTDSRKTDSSTKARDSLSKHEGLGIFAHAKTAQTDSAAEWADLIHSTLLTEGDVRNREMYLSCPTFSSSELLRCVQDTVDRLGENWHVPARRSVKRLEKIAVLVLYISNLFWPPGFKHSAVEKLFGAVSTFLKRQLDGSVTPSISDIVVSETLDELHRLIAQIHNFTSVFAGSEPDLHLLPSHFSKAWMRFVMAFVQPLRSSAKVAFVDASDFSRIIDLQQLSNMVIDLSLGERELMSTLSGENLSSFEICPSRGLLALLAYRSCKGIMRGTPGLVQIYEDYFRQLRNKMVEDPFQRSHRDVLREFHQETSALIETLQHQFEVLKGLDKFNAGFGKRPDKPDLPVFRQPPSLDRKLRHSLAEAAYRTDTFRALQRNIDALDAWQLSQIETNKDKQEAAIILFTLVTVIFLPLSFVSSVLGMNTSDVRNMEGTQWIFWIVAVPLTASIVVLSLWSADLLGGVPGRIKSYLRTPKVKRRQFNADHMAAAGPYRNPLLLEPHPPGHGLARRVTFTRPLPMSVMSRP